LGRALGYDRAFSFPDVESVWNEIRGVWPAGAGITYARLEQGGLQWPCPTEDHPGTAILHEHAFGRGARAALACVGYVPTSEQVTEQYPMLLVTGRTLHQFNAGTMTMRTANSALYPRDTLEMHPTDAERIGLGEGQQAEVSSRYGSAVLAIAISERVAPGELFATFHTPAAFVNRLTGLQVDADADTPEYKVTAVRVRPAPVQAVL
jgi:formate dehydrogenase major subunit